MQAGFAQLLPFVVLLNQAARGTTETADTSAGTWGSILWIVLMVVVTIVLLALVLVSLRGTRE